MPITNHQTIEQRNELRAKIIQRIGIDYTIKENVRNTIAELVAAGWRIISEEFTCHRLTFQVNPLKCGRALLDAERELMTRFGNAPHNLATDFNSHRLTFYAN